MKCPRCGELFADESTEHAPDVCSGCADSEDFCAQEGAWRPSDGCERKRFFAVDDGGDSYTIVARDVEHAKQILRDHGVEFTKDDGDSAPIDHPEFAALKWHEISAERVARTTVFLDDGRNKIPLVDAELGDFFSSEF